MGNQEKIEFDLYDVQITHLITDGSIKLSGKMGQDDRVPALHVFAGAGKPGWALRVSAEWVNVADLGF